MVEAINKISGGSLLRLSPQQLVDCASNDSTGNSGCDGGHPVWTYPWLMSNKLIQESDYPYIDGETGKCQGYWNFGKVGVKIKYGYGLYEHRPDQLKAALKYGPVAISVDADSALFRDYRGGVIKSPACGENLGHAVLAVGYGSYGGWIRQRQDYVIIKNSWGTDWGEDGFVRITLDQSYGPKGICGVLMDSSIGTNQVIE